MKEYIIKSGEKLRYGLTTGSCAAAASAAALDCLLTSQPVSQASITLPSGQKAMLEIADCTLKEGYALCGVVKDGGDDPDITTGTKIYAGVTLKEEDITIIGGKGVGRVTAKGLRCKVGEPAINPVPRKMIIENLKNVMKKHGYKGGAEVEIIVPDGERLAPKTFNPRLGIVGGISILGTTGIVEPMSEKALIETIKVLIDKKYEENSEIILIAPGNFGKDFCKEYLGFDIEKAVAISNFVGEALDYIKYKGFKKILLVGHTGKLIKLAAGVMNTHSSYADCRMEIIGVHSGIAGAESETMKQIMNAITTDEAFDILKDERYYGTVKESILDKVMYHLNFRLKDQVEIGVIMFTTGREHIIKSENADELIRLLEEE